MNGLLKHASRENDHCAASPWQTASLKDYDRIDPAGGVLRTVPEARD
jgi:hypothetical protein